MSPIPKFTRDSPTPIYEQIYVYLKAAINDGDFSRGQKLPSTRSLAKTLGVNHLTLRQALQKLEKEGLIATASSRGSFIVGEEKKNLQLALILPNLNEGSSLLSTGVSALLADTQSTIDIFHYSEDTCREVQNFERLITERYDGAIIYPSLEQETMHPLMKLIVDGFPLVFIARAPTTIPCWSVLADNEHGGYLATQHLIQQGATRIACEYSSLAGADQRFHGFLRAMGDNRLPVDYALVHKFSRQDNVIEEIIAKWLAHDNPPDGIVFANDFQALRGLRALTSKHNIKVPKDIRIIGFDNLSICELGVPPISSIRQDYPTIGQAAAQLLLEQIALPKEKRGMTRQLNVPVTLVPRLSS